MSPHTPATVATAAPSVATRRSECYVCYTTTQESLITEHLAHRDLRNRSAEILREVAAGASYEVTNHGEVVALLTPPAPDGGLRVRRATSSRRFSDIRRVRRTESTSSAVDHLRGDW